MPRLLGVVAGGSKSDSSELLPDRLPLVPETKPGDDLTFIVLDRYAGRAIASEVRSVDPAELSCGFTDTVVRAYRALPPLTKARGGV
jgi:hypothetical protein